MRRRALFTTVLFAGLLATPQSVRLDAQAIAVAPAAAACSKNWVGHEAEFESAIREGKVARIEDVPIGVTKPQRARLEPGGPVGSFAWKVLPPGYKSGYMESYKAEIAAYELDKLLDMHMVPPIVERQVSGLKGAAIYWIENIKNWDKDHPPTGPEPQWSYQISRMKMFDLLIANIDRNQGNLLYDADWHLFLIDHSRAFIGKKDLKNITPLSRVDRALWEKMTALTVEGLKASPVGQWVSDNELKAMIIRRDAMAASIKDLVAKRGEPSVFF
ncbi:MAG: hypothetical protein ABI665_04510 [Vicinamibacterales bacterium]